ncbi:hypothetical protein G5C60_20215 [Streptomyces sp. HC44]|uniref:Uncharacterized protein n=1 Tax=Streptomyces scabichelini TaxID=2711217 RepID=A0A6G4V7R7_9ACTN|nr:hypothetical protein [Streptomyces scabichelini]NGO09864.1 hypothetical protein [Streptomyces scabichelini]
MAENKELVVTDIPSAKLKAVADRVALQFQLAADKVAAHHGDPAKYPLPSAATTTEQLLARRFKELPEGQRKEAVDKITVELKGSTSRTKRFGDLARVDLKSSAGVEAQISRLPFPETLKFPETELQRMVHSLVGDVSGSVAQATGTELRNLELRIHKIKCVKETGGEIGQDDIDLSGTAVDEDGGTHPVPKFRVRQFDSGEVHTYSPPKQFTTFSLTENSKVTFPKVYTVILVLSDADKGGISEFLSNLLDKVREEVAKAVTKAITGKLDDPSAAVIMAIGLAVSYVLGEIVDLLKRVWSDEILKPVAVQTVISSPNSRWAGQPNSPEKTIDFTGKGAHYQLTYDWEMYN